MLLIYQATHEIAANQFLFFTIVATGFGLFLYTLNAVIYSLKGQKYQNRYTFKTYEFGTITIGNAQTLSNSHFFLLSALFIIFDVELLFMYLWVAGYAFNGLLLYKLSFFAFAALLIIGLIYELLKGALSWYRIKQ